MEYAQNPYSILRDAIGNDIGRAANHQFSRTLDAAGAAAVRKPRQGCDLFTDAGINGDGGFRTVSFDVIEDLVAVGLREDGPLQPRAFARG